MITRLICRWRGHRWEQRRTFTVGLLEEYSFQRCSRCKTTRTVRVSPAAHVNCRCMMVEAGADLHAGQAVHIDAEGRAMPC